VVWRRRRVRVSVTPPMGASARVRDAVVVGIQVNEAGDAGGTVSAKVKTGAANSLTQRHGPDSVRVPTTPPMAPPFLVGAEVVRAADKPSAPAAIRDV